MFEMAEYMAGFFDGEGCISIYKNGRVQLSIAQVVRKPLDLMQEMYGGHVYLERKSHKNPKWQDVYKLIISTRRDCKRFLEDIYPYLMVKDEKAEQALELLSNVAENVTP